MAVELVGRPADGDPDAGLFHSAELENILRAVNGGGVLTTSISATVTGTSRVITVPAFNAWVPDGSGGLVYVAFAGSTVTMDAADATNPRTDIIHLSSAGALGETAGVATALSSTVVEAPMPDLPAGTILLGKIAIPAAQAYVLEADINGRAIDVSERGHGFTTKGTDIVCAATIALPDIGQFFHVTGATGPVTAIESRPAGFVLALTFEGAPTLTYNATSLILLNGASKTLAAGTTLVFISEGSGNWREIVQAPAATKEIFLPVLASGSLFPYTGQIGEHPFDTAQDTEIARFAWRVPDDFTSLTTCEVLISPDATETVQYDVATHFAADGEAYNANSDSLTDSTKAVTLDQLDGLDISGALTGIAAGDIIGVTFTSNTTLLRVLGAWFKYA